MAQLNDLIVNGCARFLNTIKGTIENAEKVNNHTVNKDVPSDAVFTDHTYNFSGTTFYSGNSGTAEHNADNALKNGNYYYNSNGPSTALGASSTDGALYVQSYSDSWVGQIAQDYRNGKLQVRGKNNGTWYPWLPVMTFEDTFGLIYTATKFKFDGLTRKIQASKSTSSWDAQIYSSQGYAHNCFVAFKPSQANMAIMMGLDSNPTEDASYANIDYCWYIQNDGKLSIYESGTSKLTPYTYAVGDDLRIEYDGTNIRYLHNGVVKRTVARSISGKLYVDSSFHGVSGAVYDFNFGQTTYSANSANNASKSQKLIGSDTRNINSAPSSYMITGEPASVVSEFKSRSAIGAYGSATFGTLLTMSPWGDYSGGLPVQMYLENGNFPSIRWATSTSAWGAWSTLAQMIYPVGSIISVINPTFDPNVAYVGTTWARLKDCVVYAAGDSDTLGAIVGSNTHTISESELPSHTHAIPALSGTTNETGSHHHSYNVNSGINSPGGGQDNQYKVINTKVAETPAGATTDAGNHSHSVTTNASTTGNTGSGTAMDVRGRRINAYVWLRTA